MRKNFLRLTVILGVLLLMSSCASMMASMDLKSAPEFISKKAKNKR